MEYIPVEVHLNFDFSRYRHDTSRRCRNAGIVQTIKQDLFSTSHTYFTRLRDTECNNLCVCIGVLDFKNTLFSHLRYRIAYPETLAYYSNSSVLFPMNLSKHELFVRLDVYQFTSVSNLFQLDKQNFDYFFSQFFKNSNS